MLSHLTKSIDNLLSILETGLIFFPNDRDVFSNLTEDKLSEPQCQGMILFTDIPFEHSENHRDMFGDFGIVIDKSWAITNGACKVIYVGSEGEVFTTFKSLFSLLKPKIKKTGNKHLDDWVNELCLTKQ